MSMADGSGGALTRPKYLELADSLRADVLSGLDFHEAIPTERELQKTYGVSRATVRRALARLIDEGVLYSVRGSGTYLADPSLIRKDLRLTSFSQDMSQRGHTPDSTPLGCDIVAAPERLAEQLSIAVGSQIVRLHRLRLADGAPMALEIAHLPLDVLGGRLPDPHASLDQHLIECGHRAESAYQSIRAVNLTAEEAGHLLQPVGAAALRVARLAFDGRGRPVEQTETTYRADRYGFDLTVIRTPKDHLS